VTKSSSTRTSTKRKGNANMRFPGRKPSPRAARKLPAHDRLLPRRKTAEERRREREISAQQSIPYMEMSPGGICRVDEHTYSKTIRFEDINYQLCKEDEQRHIFANWCDFLNYFDSTIHVQISFVNHRSDLEEYRRIIDIPSKNDGHDDVREEYSAMLKHQLTMGHNGIVKDKYITFSIHAENIREAAPKLRQIEKDVRRNFKAMGVPSQTLNGEERLRIMYETFHPDTTAPFRFSWEDLAASGLTTKDYIAPSSFTFRDGRTFLIGDTPCAMSWLQIQASQLRDDLLSDFLDVDANLIVNMHIQPVEQNQAVKEVRSTKTNIQKMKLEEQQKAIRGGYDMDLIPTDLKTYDQEADSILEDLQSRNERLFNITVLFMNTEATKEELNNVLLQMKGYAQSGNCLLQRLDYLQEEGVMSSLPLGKNFVPIERALTTTSTSGFIPFTTQELFMGGESLYYGLNATSDNMIMADRKKLKTPNGLILGTPGSGKSFAAKREITNAWLVTDDDIIICDPEGEYYPLVNALGGQVIHLSSSSRDYINPMDFNINYGGDDDDPLTCKADFILSLCELIMHSRGGLQPIERTVIDRSVTEVYTEYMKDPRPENMPTLGDLHEHLKRQPEKEGAMVAASMDLFVNGNMKLFNHRTNVELHNRIICFDIHALDNTLKKLGMFIVQDQVWNRVTRNRTLGRSTRYYQDEFHVLLNQEQTAAYSVQIWKRFRKWGGIPTGITQNVNDLRKSPEINNIFENSDFIIMLNQRGEDQEMLAHTLNISPSQLKYVTWSEEGEGLLFFGNTILPFKDRLPKNTKLYQLITTKPEDLREQGHPDFR